MEGTTKTTLEMLVIHRLAEVTKDSILQSTPPDDLVRVCGNRIVGIVYPAATRYLWSSRPVIPGI